MEVLTLEKICEAKSSNIAQKDLENNNGCYPIYGASGFIKNVDFYKFEEPYLAIVKDGAGVGRVMVLPGRSSIIGTMQAIIPNDNVDIDYLFYYLKSKKLGRYYTGATIPHIYFKDYKFEKCNIYSLEEQRKISKKLKLIDNLIDYKNKQIEHLNQVIKSQFVEMFVEENNYKILKDICEFVTVGIANSATQAYRDSGVVLFRNQNILENKLDETDLLYIDDVFSNKYKNKLLKENDILATRTGYPGVACLVPKRYEGAQTFTTLIARLKKDKQINPIYICHFINSKYGKEFVASNKVGVAQQNLGAKTFELMPIKIPPVELQNKFAQIVEQIDKQKFEFERSLKKLEELQASLMQEYFG